MKVYIDLDRCYRSGECYYNHPELFTMGDGGDPELKLRDLDVDLAAALERHAREAAEVCPAAAITVRD